jgi:hypothetical protein
MPGAALPSKPCATCGRTMTWRAKWAKNWESVRYCSDGCRRGPDATDRALEAAIVALLGQRAAGATICPSEAARAVAADWEPLRERAAAGRGGGGGDHPAWRGGGSVDGEGADPGAAAVGARAGSGRCASPPR